MKKLLAIILALVMALSLATLAGCGDDKDEGKSGSIEGTWQGEVDLSGMFVQSLVESLGYDEDAANELGIDFRCDSTWKFENGDFSIEFDRSSVEAVIEKNKPMIKTVSKEYFTKAMAEYGYSDLDIDSLISSISGYSSFDEMIDKEFGDVDKALDSLNKSGKYKAEDDKLTLIYKALDSEDADDEDVDDEDAEETYKEVEKTYKIELNDDTLKITDQVDGDETGMVYALPVTLKRK